MSLYVYSGKCRIGKVGQPTPFHDLHDNPLFVGDIVCVYHEGALCGSLTAVVSDEFTTYSNGEHRIKDGPVDHFVMGIKSVSMDDPKGWAVIRVKHYSHVVANEKWPDYGFNYREEAN